jgi:hypothetical protein
LRQYVFIFLAVILISCSSSDISTTPGTVKPVEINLTNADSLWSLRAYRANAEYALELFKQLSASDSTSIPTWAKLSRAYYFCGQYLTESSLRQDSLFLRGYEVSQTVLKQNSKYRDLLFSTGDESIAVRGLDENSLEALYWGLANYGQWLATKSSLVRMGRRELIWATLEHINDLDSTFYYGAYYRYKGALLGRDPQTENDTTGMRTAFDMAIKVAPDYLGNYRLMAQYYCPKTQNKNLFYSLLTKVVTTKPDPGLPYYAENLYEKGLAEKLMIRAEKEKWFSP